jgi:hypothetical protein
MKTRYRLIRRGTRGGMFYCVDTKTGKRTSFQTAACIPLSPGLRSVCVLVPSR